MTDLASLGFRVDSSGLRRGAGDLDRFGNSGDRVDRTATRLSSRTFPALISVVGVASAALGGLTFGRIISEFASFEQGMQNVGAVSSATTMQLEALSDEALRAAASTRFNPAQTTKALYALASSGQAVEEQMASLPNVLNLAEAGQADLGRATELTTATINQFNLEAEDSGRVADVFVAAIAASSLNVNRLQVAMRNAGPTAAALGQSLEATTATLGILTTSFGNGERAGTGFRAILNELPDKAAELGISIKNANGQFKPMVDILEELENKGITANKAVSDFGAEAGPALAALITQGSAALREMEGQLQSTGQAADTAAKQMDTLRGDMDAFGSAVDVAFIKIGDAQSTVLRGAIQQATDLVRLWSGYGDTLGDAAEQTEALADASAVLGIVLSVSLASALTKSAAAMVARKIATVQGINADAAASAALLRRTGAEKAVALALVNTSRIDVAATAGTNAHTFATTQLSIARQRAAVAAGAHAAATATATQAITVATVAARGLAGAMALLGGPIGIALIAAGSLYYFRDALFDTSPELKGLTEDTKKLVAELGKATKAQRELINAGFQQSVKDQRTAILDAEQAIVSVNARLEDFRRSVGENVPDAVFNSNSAVQSLREELTDAGLTIDNANSKIDAITKNQKEFWEEVEKTSGKIDDLTGSTDGLTGSTGAASAAIQLELTFLRAHNALIESGVSATEAEVAIRETKQELQLESKGLTAAEAVEYVALGNAIDDATEAEKRRQAALMASTKIGVEDDPMLARIAAQKRGQDIMVQDKKDFATATQRLDQSILASASSTASGLASVIAESQGKQSKAYQAAFLLQQGFAIASSIVNTQMAAAAAVALPPIGLGPVLGAPYAATIEALGAANVAIIAAQTVSGLASNASGARAMGGSVTGGNSYMVGENGPEVVTMGGSGVVTPSSVGGGGMSVVINDQTTTSTGHDVQTQETTGPEGQRQMQVTIRDTVRRQMMQGEFDRQLGSKFDLKSKGRRV